MPRKKTKKLVPVDPQKSSAAQFLTYVASTGSGGEKYEIRYEDENIWMSQKMLAEVYGVEVPNISYHLRKLFEDAELDEGTCLKEILIDIPDGRKFNVKHYNLQVIIALGFKIDNERAVQFRKWANQKGTGRECHGGNCPRPRRVRVREIPRRPRQAFHERLRPLSP